MIKSFKSKDVERIWNGEIVRALPIDIQKVARRKLRILNNATDLNDLKIPPANRLEALKGNRKDQYSIRVNEQWRICFEWTKGNCYNVEIADYHS
ncbi:MAG: type II toxin-antitoxin system RelE/ParE family toxin [Proteobacteria bacterium]|nr:type II toxin-antitoxin system RelE/ParE family toxin [Pseudomonadota bacterium]